MARDNKVSAAVTIRPSTTICNDSSIEAAREFYAKIREEFGSMVMVGPVRVEYTDDNDDKNIVTYSTRDLK